MEHVPASGGGLMEGTLSRRRLLGFAVGLAGVGAASLLAACGGQRTAGGNDAIVQMTENKTYSPERVTILRGNAVVWTNVTKDTVHTATCDPTKAKNPQDVSLPQGAKPWDSGDVPAGQVFTQIFDVPGEYTYFCSYFETEGMVGRITVTTE